MNNFKVLMNGIVKENPTFVLLLGMCPTLSIREIVLRWSGRMGPVSLLCLRYWQEYRRLLQVVFLFRVM